VSISTGSPFLGRFNVTEKDCHVAFVSAESGPRTIRETRDRVEDAKKTSTEWNNEVLWLFGLPNLDSEETRSDLLQMIDEYEIQLLILDPAYLILPDFNAAQIHSAGASLRAVSRIGLRTGCSICLLAHTTKQSAGNEPLTLDAISGVGLGEWARQWMLISRRQAYTHNGFHQLWLTGGGSAGHSYCHGLDIDEGTHDDTGDERFWRPNVTTESLDGPAARLVLALRDFPDGETARVLRESSGMNSYDFKSAIKTLIESKRAKAIKVTKANREYDGFMSVGRVGQTQINSSPGGEL